MIDVMKELEKYKPLCIGENVQYDEEISNLFAAFNKTIERIGKDQYKSLRRIDEIIEALEEKKNLENIIDSLRAKIESHEGDNKDFLIVIIKICDLTENMHLYSMNAGDMNFKSQMELQWRNLQQYLLKCGITRFGNTGDIFDKELHIAVRAVESESSSQGRILEVVKSGYQYKGCLVRRAEVVISM